MDQPTFRIKSVNLFQEEENFLFNKLVQTLAKKTKNCTQKTNFCLCRIIELMLLFVM